MQKHEWDRIRDWFHAYGAGFYEDDGKLHPLLQVKSRHSRRVAANARDIARDLGFAEPDVWRAQTAGLLHDVGRFTQFREFRTFSDIRSIDHGERGFQVLGEATAMAGLPASFRNDLLASVRYHNKRALPDNLTPSERRLTEIVRDSDKFDIYRVILDSVESGEYEKNEAVFLSMPSGGAPNPVIVDCIRRGTTASYEHIRNRTDFVLQLLSWTSDLAFDVTCRRLSESGLFDAMADQLPDEPVAREAAAWAKEHLVRRCR